MSLENGETGQTWRPVDFFRISLRVPWSSGFAQVRDRCERWRGRRGSCGKEGKLVGGGGWREWIGDKLYLATRKSPSDSNNWLHSPDPQALTKGL